MKIQGAKKIHYDSGPNMTPLVDVVMVILIFLMLAGSFGGVSHFLLSKQGIKAKGGVAHEAKADDALDTPIDIYVDNMKDVDGYVVRVTGMDQMTNAEDLRKALVTKRQQFLLNGTPPDKIQVILHPRVDTRYRYLIAVYQAANQAEIEKIAFAVSQ